MRVGVLVMGWLVMAACQDDTLVSEEQFEITAIEGIKYCDADDVTEKSYELAGQIDVFDTDGVKQHTGALDDFTLEATLTCADGNPASIALTAVGNADDSGKVSYTQEDSETTVELAFSEKTVTLASDPPLVHADHRLRTWFGYDASEKVRVVLRKRENLDETLAADFFIATYVWQGIKFSDSSKTGHVDLRLSLPY